MKIQFKLHVPSWLLPKWLRTDLERRSEFNGSASRSWTDKYGISSVQVTAERQDRT